MDSPPQRTNLTDLTTDQLLLFDFLFQYRLFERQLRRDVYPLHLNVNYSHGLDDEELSASLKSLEHRGDVTSCETEEGRQWELTPAGGHKWELERNPCWSTYCETRWGESHSGDKVLYSVVSLSERVRAQFLGDRANDGILGSRLTARASLDHFPSFDGLLA